MSSLPYTLDPDDPQVTPLGLIVLQTDETLEPEFAKYFAGQNLPFYVSRIPSAAQVSTDSLAQMEVLLPAAADLLPKARPYRVRRLWMHLGQFSHRLRAGRKDGATHLRRRNRDQSASGRRRLRAGFGGFQTRAPFALCRRGQRATAPGLFGKRVVHGCLCDLRRSR